MTIFYRFKAIDRLSSSDVARIDCNTLEELNELENKYNNAETYTQHEKITVETLKDYKD